MLRELKTFLAIARSGTFSDAGNRIGLTQSAVSAQIKRLEDELQVTLFERSGRSAKLNDAGRRLVGMAEKMLASYQELRERLRSDVVSGTIRIGAISTVQTGLLPDALVSFRKKFPHVEVKINPGVSAQLLDQMDAEEFDLIIVIRPPFALPKELHWQPLISEPYVLIAPATIRADTPVRMLERYPFIRYDRRSFGGRQVQRFLTQQRITVNEVMELDELEAIVKMVERGLGVSVIPRSSIPSLQTSKVRTISLGHSTFYREIGIIEASARAHKPLTAALISRLRKVSAARSVKKRLR